MEKNLEEVKKKIERANAVANKIKVIIIVFGVHRVWGDRCI